ncbi:unnamed protein product [Mytilus edulis]|uniref:Reverse transcriptase domain-containing protein n=1 Tax=Mytilus edulis TaxID=6550 RepID=A0A8S3R172_MYTED|nr:unnamed protein product [Mytilus edulis]
MKFIPNPKHNNLRKQILMDFNELARKMRCKFHYSGKNNKKHIHPLYLQSGHIPPRGNIALENYLIDTKLDISKLEVKQFRDNLSKLERKALTELKHNDSIYISKADKNNTTVVVNKIDYIKAGTSHLNNTKDFINRIESHEVRKDCILIAYDVTSMYTNMNIDNLEETVINALESIDTQEYTLKIPNKKDLTAFVKLILRNNEFEFNGQLYKQIIGAPMGGIFSPTCTDLHLSVLLINILDKFQWRENIKLHCQYRDDGFMMIMATNITKEEDNFLRIVYLNYRVGTKALRRYFDNVHPNLLSDLSSPTNKSILAGLHKPPRGQRRVLYREQWDILYPPSGNFLIQVKCQEKSVV